MNGKINVGDASVTHDPFHTLVLSAGGQETGVSVTAVEGDTDFVLVWIVSRVSEQSSYIDARRDT
jgi:hypothetical protein